MAGPRETMKGRLGPEKGWQWICLSEICDYRSQSYDAAKRHELTKPTGHSMVYRRAKSL